MASNAEATETKDGILMETLHTDIVVVGSGSAGLTAAVVAARHGLRVMLLEKRETVGGTSAWSGGGCWVPCNSLMSEVKVEDSRADAEAYIRAAVGDYLREDLLGAFLENAPRMIDWMLANTEVRFAPRTPFPDAQMNLPGARVGGRSLASVEYDGRRLGSWLSRLEPPFRSFNAPLGMMLSPADVPHALNIFRNPRSFFHMVRLGLRFGWDLLRHGRSTRLTMGNALVARLLQSALAEGVTVMVDSPVQTLTFENGAVKGVIARCAGRHLRIEAERGVLLAAGGGSANPEWQRQHSPYPGFHEALVCPGNVGDGLRMAQEVGANQNNNNLRNGAFDVVSALHCADGRVERALHFIRDLPKPGCMVVGADGRRFANEANLRLGQAMTASGNVPAWLVCDRRFVRRYGVGLVLPFGLNSRAMRRAGYLIEAVTIEALGSKIGVPCDALAASVARFNEFARAGVDDEFGRGASPGERALGDAEAGFLNPNLGTIEAGPFCAVKLVIGDVGSVLGLKVDSCARVLDAGDRPIPGLYAAGLDMNSVWAGAAIGAGLNHAHNMTFAYIAARTMADQR